jgi:hypothetical protein
MITHTLCECKACGNVYISRPSAQHGWPASGCPACDAKEHSVAHSDAVLKSFAAFDARVEKLERGQPAVPGVSSSVDATATAAVLSSERRLRVELKDLARGWMTRANSQMSKGSDLKEDDDLVGANYRFGHAAAMSDCAIILAKAIGYELNLASPGKKEGP